MADKISITISAKHRSEVDEDSQLLLIWQKFPVKRCLLPDHLLFEDGDVACHQGSKIIPVENRNQSIKVVTEFSCCISGCGETFNSVSRYESHYNVLHRNRCSVCKRVFPSNHLLEIHILEWHDAMFELLAAKQNMYQCLVESCQEKFKSTKSRKTHVIEIHHLPANYRFDKVKQSKSTPVENVTDNEQENNNSMEVDEPIIISDGSAKRIFSYKVPKNISFGQGCTRGFARRPRGTAGKHWHQTKTDIDTSINIENVVMSDLTDALNSS